MLKKYSMLFTLGLLLPAGAAVAQQGGTPPDKTPPYTTPNKAGETPQGPSSGKASTEEEKEERMSSLEMDMPDAELASRIHTIHQHEIAMANIAINQASWAKLKDYAKGLLDDHTKADKKLTELASKKGWTLTNALAESDKFKNMNEKLDEMKSRTGTNFDRNFLVMMQKGHGMAILTMTAQAFAYPVDGDLRKLIKSEMPMLEKNRKKAIDLIEQESTKTQPTG